MSRRVITDANAPNPIGASMGGGGGGKPHLATAGGKDLDSLKNALSKSFEIIDDFIKGQVYAIQTRW